MAQRNILMLAALASGAYAASSSTADSSATSTMNVILPMLDSQTAVMGSIMGVDATATTYYLTCPTDASALTCGLGEGIELVEGDSTLEVHFTESAIGTIDVNCAVASNTASCTTTLTTMDISITGTAVAASSQVTSTGTTVVTDLSSYSLAVTVTAGLEKLAAATGTTDSTASGTAAGTAASSTATGGVPRATQNAVLLGAAAMVGGALLM